ncbi:unnamed protein product [Eruca vesicaria subsp. sativa]|uniref:Uncharacterized protein n=1 Tax=Eruca vesicaria subsp. sativa TaxID=29727 RepID=A0ABC8JCV8_ERUVS|nr:unnamed protein product [Eruca vesicaria subsp. sativa]
MRSGCCSLCTSSYDDLQRKPVPVMNNVEQEKTESFIKHGSNTGNDILKLSHDAPQSSRFNSDSVDSAATTGSRAWSLRS